MKKFKKNFALAFLCILVVIFFSAEFITHFFFQQPIDSIVSQNRTAVAHIYAGEVPVPHIRNVYFELALPTGMEVFALDKNNLKLRYQRFYFEVHTFTSKIDSLEYSKAKFPVEFQHNLASFHEKPVFFYVKPVSAYASQFALYTDSVEIVTTVPSVALETALLKSVELMRNIRPLDNTEAAIIIGGDERLSGNQGTPILGTDEQEDEAANNEMPLIKV